MLFLVFGFWFSATLTVKFAPHTEDIRGFLKFHFADYSVETERYMCIVYFIYFIYVCLKVFKWRQETGQLPEGIKWRTLEHRGPMFAPEYVPLPEYVRFRYDGEVQLLLLN